MPNHAGGATGVAVIEAAPSGGLLATGLQRLDVLANISPGRVMTGGS
jgi:hypothetical protein